MNETNEFAWMNRHEWIETHELKRMTWHEWFVHVDLIFKKCKKPSVFGDLNVINYLMTMWSKDEMKLWLQSPAHFVDLMVRLIFKKWSEAVSFFYDIYVKSSSRYSLVHILSTTFRIERNFPSSGDHGQPLYPKKHGFLRPRVFSAVNSHVPDRSHLMMWLTWWCGWHDDVVDMMVRQLAVTIVRNSEVS